MRGWIDGWCGNMIGGIYGGCVIVRRPCERFATGTIVFKAVVQKTVPVVCPLHGGRAKDCPRGQSFARPRCKALSPWTPLCAAAVESTASATAAFHTRSMIIFLLKPHVYMRVCIARLMRTHASTIVYHYVHQLRMVVVHVCTRCHHSIHASIYAYHVA